MSAEHFLDTNIFVYMFDETDPIKRQRAETLVRDSLTNMTGCISYQVVQETLNVLIQRLNVSVESAMQLLDDILIPLWQINPTTSLYRAGLRVHARYGFSYYDSLIVAAALEAGCTRLYTEDLQHGQQVQTLTIENPFRDWTLSPTQPRS